MIEKISEDELELYELLTNPVACSEILFSNFDNLTEFTDKLSSIRIGQFPLFSYEYSLDYNPQLSAKENFKLRERVSSLYCFGARRAGKSLVGERLDLLLYILHGSNETCGFSSYDAQHIEGVLEPVVNALESHPIIKDFVTRIKRKPYFFLTKNGISIFGVNMNLNGKNVAKQFFQHHFSRLYVEEASFITEEIHKVMIDSVSDYGSVFRFLGMSNFTKHSPVGEIFYNREKQGYLYNFPQYINPFYTNADRLKAIKDYGGELSPSFLIFVEGKVIETGVSAMDMERVRACYNEDKEVKRFEVDKNTVRNYKDYIFVERPENAEECILSADIGEEASPTEIMVWFLVNGVYNYRYNITLNSLIDTEQIEIFKYLIIELKANYTGLDTTSGFGRVIARNLIKEFSNDNIVCVSFNEKIEIDLDRDDNGEVIFFEGKPQYKDEYVSEWSMKRIKDLCYSSKVNIALDFKFDMQLNNIVVTQSGNRTLYENKDGVDHLRQAMQVFAIVQWKTEFTKTKPLVRKKFSKVGV